MERKVQYKGFKGQVIVHFSKLRQFIHPTCTMRTLELLTGQHISKICGGNELISEYYTRDLASHFRAAAHSLRPGTADVAEVVEPYHSGHRRTVHDLMDLSVKSSPLALSAHVDAVQYEETCRSECNHFFCCSAAFWYSLPMRFRILLQALRHFDIFSQLDIERAHLYRFFTAVKVHSQRKTSKSRGSCLIFKPCLRSARGCIVVFHFIISIMPSLQCTSPSSSWTHLAQAAISGL
eukprot:2759482-Amphidinium_carterae.2